MTVCIAKALGWACDARTLLGTGAIWWLVSAAGKRRTALRYLSVLATTTALHHAIKRFVDQRQPDRIIPTRGKHALAGRASDGFLSGHAMHAGALASFPAGSGTGSPQWLWSPSARWRCRVSLPWLIGIRESRRGLRPGSWSKDYGGAFVLCDEHQAQAGPGKERTLENKNGDDFLLPDRCERISLRF